MKQKMFLFWFIIVGFVLGIVSTSSAWHWNISKWLCIEEIIEVPPIPVGCEMVDCCPGCPGPDPIDWHIKLEGDPVDSVILKFENLSKKDKKTLHIKGNAKWLEGNRLWIGKGKTIVSGFPVDIKRQPAVAIPQVIMDKGKVIKYIEAADKELDILQKDGIKLEFVVEQMIGNIVVNEFRFAPIFRICRPPYTTPTPSLQTDKIDLDNNATNDNAVVLLDARRNSGCVNDEIWRGNNIISLGSVLSNGNCNSEVAVFSDDDSMHLIENVQTWTNNLGDTLKVDLTPDLLREQVTFWVMQGPFANTQARIINDMARANQLYNTMNCGIGFQTIAINDATQNQNTPLLLNANCGQSANLRNQIGFTAGQLNVYYLNNPGARGWWCGNNTIIIGATADNESLAHEIGHAFTLGHTNTIAGIPNTNLMVTGGTGRNSITEGQCFRCNVNTGSTLNTNGVRTGTTRNCPDTTNSATCPALSLDVTPE